MAQEVIQETVIVWFRNGSKIDFTIGHDVSANECIVLGEKGYYWYGNCEVEHMKIFKQ